MLTRAPSTSVCFHLGGWTCTPTRLGLICSRPRSGRPIDGPGHDQAPATRQCPLTSRAGPQDQTYPSPCVDRTGGPSGQRAVVPLRCEDQQVPQVRPAILGGEDVRGRLAVVAGEYLRRPAAEALADGRCLIIVLTRAPSTSVCFHLVGWTCPRRDWD